MRLASFKLLKENIKNQEVKRKVKEKPKKKALHRTKKRLSLLMRNTRRVILVSFEMRIISLRDVLTV